MLQLPSRKRERLLQALRHLAGSLHEEPLGIEKDATGRDLLVRIIGEWEITYWADWEKELRIIRLAQA